MALEQVRWWLERPSTVLAHESSTYLDDLAALCESSGVAGPAIHDVRIAAIYLGNGVREMWSADRDFSRFTALRVINTLQVDHPPGA